MPASLTRLSQVPVEVYLDEAAAAKSDELARTDVQTARAKTTLKLDRPEQLKALGHPLRLKVLQVLGSTDEPLTNRELAARLEVDPGHLHFHVRMLHRAGLIELAARATAARSPTGRWPRISRSAPRSAPPGSRAISRPRSSAS